jgi:hypothetical protein
VKVLVDAELVQQHLDAFVRVNDLDTAHESGGRFLDFGEEKVMARSTQEVLGPGPCRRVVEQVTCAQNDLDVVGYQVSNPHGDEASSAGLAWSWANRGEMR